MAMSNVSRRSFLKVSGAAATVAGLGLAGCGQSQSGDSGAASTTVQNTPAGVPATTPPDQLPIPNKGEVCINQKSRDEVQDGGTLTMSIGEVGPDWNYYSINGNTLYMNNIWTNYMPVNSFTSDALGTAFEPNPDYIADFKVEEKDGKEVATFKIADKASFNDGTPIDYRAFEALWKCMNGQDENYTPSSTDGYQNIESVAKGSDDKEVIVTFANKFYPVEPLIAFIHPDAASVDTFNSGWNQNPHNEWGAGPFKVDSFDDTQVTFVPNEKWWGNEPKLEKIVYKQMDPQAEINAFKNGEIDALTGATGNLEYLSNFTSMSDATVRRANSYSIGNIELNASHGMFKDIAVRKAFWQCIDVPTFLSIQYQGVNWSEDTPGSLLFMPWQDGYVDNTPEDVKSLKTTDEKTAAAKKTLEDAGYSLGDDGYYAKDGSKISVSFATFGDSTTVKNRTAAIQTMAKSAGIEVVIENHPSSEFSTVLTSGNWDACLFGWSGTATSYNNGGQMYGSKSESNLTTLGSEELDNKFLEAVGIEDLEEHKKAVNEAEAEAMKSYAFIPMFVGADVSVTKANLANVGPHLFLSILPEDVGWAKEA